MSCCECESSTSYRITGEIWYKENIGGETEDDRYARIRCNKCQGKVGLVPTKFLEKFGIDREDIRNERCLEDPVEITIDLG